MISVFIIRQVNLLLYIKLMFVLYLIFVTYTCSCPFLRAEVAPVTYNSIFHLRVQLVPLKQKTKNKPERKYWLR